MANGFLARSRAGPRRSAGILAAAGFDGFLTGRDALYERADDDLDADR
jgi:hypothetical protein